MTRLLEKAIKRLKQLPNEEQNRFANIVLDEITWQQLFDQSQKQLDALGEQVLKEIKQGKFKKIKR
ncbi:MAG: hypothetical protein SH857_15970 [Chitinophagales bacterium]|nr:hypothetical protein [Chitinophagales bacterium]